MTNIPRVSWLIVLAISGCAANVTPQPQTARAVQPPTLQFSELIASDGALRESERALELSGKRVRMVGFMVEMEQAPRGVFYLAPRPLSCDEAGGGTGDLPVESVLVSVPFMHDASIPHVAGALEVVGTFDTGNRVDANGYASTFRLRVDDGGPALKSN